MITHSFYFIPRGKTIKAITAYMEYMMDKKATRKLTILYNKRSEARKPRGDSHGNEGSTKIRPRFWRWSLNIIERREKGGTSGMQTHFIARRWDWL